MKKQLKRKCIVYGLGIIVYAGAVWGAARFMLSDQEKFAIFLGTYLLIGYGAFQKLSEEIMEKRFPVEYILVIFATIGAFGIGKYMEAVIVMLMFELGMLAEQIATDRTKRSIAKMIDLRPTYAIRKVKGQEVQVDPSELKMSHIIVIKPGERIPVDAVVLAGSSTIDTKAITGEAMPVEVYKGDKIYSGCINQSGVLEARVTRIYKDSIVSRIMETVEEAQNRKSQKEAFVTRFSKVYAPIMVLLSVLIMVIPPSTFSYGNWETWIYKGLIFIIVACPCALAVAAPLAFLGGIASAARQGIVVKGGNFLESLVKADTFIFDKTGTLTKAEPTVLDIVSFNGMKCKELLRIAACLEEHFPHSMAKAVVQAAVDRNLVHEELHSEVEYIVAHGISSMIENKKVVIGSYHFVFEDEQCTIPEGKEELFEKLPEECSHLYMAIEGKLAGVICIEDPLREEAKDVIKALKAAGIKKVVMMTGDSDRTAKVIAAKVGVDEYHAEVLPEDKAAFVEKEKAEGRKVIMIGDGINDSPALSASNVGIAISDGAQIAREIADVTIEGDHLHGLVTLKHISNHLMRRIHNNYRFIVGFNAGLIGAGVLGFIQPTTSAVLHNTSTLCIGLRSMKNLVSEEELQ